MILFLQLFLAHLIGDFVLQSREWVKRKQLNKIRSFHLYMHVLLHGALVMLLVWEINFWLPAVIIMGTHLLIDCIRVYLPQKNNNVAFFLIDQSLHLLILVLIVIWWQDMKVSVDFLQNSKFWIHTTGFVFVTVPSSVIIRIMVNRWYVEAKLPQDETLKNAGSFIGILERLFILVFVISGRWEGIGFLFAAKSIFRFADIKGHPDRKLTEYFIIGTLLSIGLALFTGLIINYLIAF